MATKDEIKAKKIEYSAALAEYKRTKQEFLLAREKKHSVYNELKAMLTK